VPFEASTLVAVAAFMVTQVSSGDWHLEMQWHVN